MGLFLLGVWIVLLGAMIWFWETAFNLLERKGWHKNKHVRKVLDWAHIEVLELSEEEKVDVIKKIEYRVRTHVKEWFEGEDEIIEIPLSKLGLDSEAVGFEPVFKCICALIEESSVSEYIEDVTICDEDFYLQIHLNMHVVKEEFQERLKEWRKQGEYERAEFWASRGVI